MSDRSGPVGRVSNFSNFGPSADVYALGRNHVNALPRRPLPCNETPDKGDIRVFRNGLARWSGTSFSAPLIAGLIAAEVLPDRRDDSPTAKDNTSTASRSRRSVSVPDKPRPTGYGQIKRLRPNF